nr:hypothetical protein [Tanacetum cinerariifolium]
AQRHVVEGEVAAAVLNVLVGVARHGGGPRHDAKHRRVGAQVNGRAENSQVGLPIGRGRAHQVGGLKAGQAIDEDLTAAPGWRCLSGWLEAAVLGGLLYPGTGGCAASAAPLLPNTRLAITSMAATSAGRVKRPTSNSAPIPASTNGSPVANTLTKAGGKGDAANSFSMPARKTGSFGIRTSPCIRKLTPSSRRPSTKANSKLLRFIEDEFVYKRPSC